MRLAGLAGGGGPKGPRLSFEVQSYKTDHWITEGICPTEQESRALAARLLPSREGIRILREFAGSSTQPPSESVIFCEMRQQTARPVTVGPVEEAPLCSGPADYLSLESRTIISRMLRQYLEQRALTTSELLHHPGEMKRAMNFESMVPTAVSRVASVQGRAAGLDVRDRRDQIYAALSDLGGRAEAASRRPLPSLRAGGFAAAMDRVEALAGADPGERDYLATVMLCRELVQVRSLLGKVEWLLDLAAGAVQGDADQSPSRTMPAAHLSIIDSLVADALSFPATIQDLLGRQPDLGTALLRLLDVLDGSYEPLPRESAPAITALLGRWIAAGSAPESRMVLLESLRRSLSLTTPLARDAEGQRARFAALLTRLLGPSGFLGGSATAQALTEGTLRFIEQGGQEGRRLGIDMVLGLLPTPRDQLLYLAELSDSVLGEREQALLQFRAEDILARQGEVNRLVPPQTPLKPKMQQLAALYRALLASGFPPTVRQALADRLDDRIAAYIVGSRVIEKLDDAEASLRVRANRLIQFAATDVLASPKARRIVRDQIIGHLRQPNFDGKYVDGLDTPQEQTAALRTFYDLLRQAEFI
ncbi:hypothetical protein [Oleisolibacter albus]|uniref:hypothetical protein n=1 Tax=Oleisolibacter albus TaxID=2171757 RepID=UPI000DF31262|nr:hypothetical protein [Oleisolibacter albus]